MADARHVQFARELAARDERIAADLATLCALQAEVENLRARAGAAGRFRAAYPAEQARLGETVAAAGADLRARKADAAAAEAERARTTDGEAQAAAERAVTRTADAASSARKRLVRVEAEREALEADAERHEADRPLLERRQAEAVSRLQAAPRVSLPRGVQAEPPLEWSARARAALLVAVGSLETDRERVVREANELAAFALADPSAATSVRLVAERIEQAAEDGRLPSSPS